MSLHNTNREEDRAIRSCANFGGDAAIVADCAERLDSALTEAHAEIAELQKEVARLEAENAELQRFNDEWVAERERIAKS